MRNLKLLRVGLLAVAVSASTAKGGGPSAAPDVFRVTDFAPGTSIAGNGSTDDGPMFRGALAACMTANNGRGFRQIFLPAPPVAYVIKSLDASGLGGIVIGDGQSANSCSFVGEALNTWGHWSGGVRIVLGDGLNRPLVYVRSHAASPVFRNLILDGNRAKQTGWAGGPSGLLFAVEVEDGVTWPEGSIQMFDSRILGGFNGDLYIGAGRGSTFLQNTWLEYSGQSADDSALLLNGYDGTFYNLSVGGNAGTGVLVNEGSQYQFTDGAIWNNANGMTIIGDHVGFLVASGLNIAASACNGIYEKGVAPYPGTQAVGHFFSNTTFVSNNASAKDACSDINNENSNRLSFVNVGFSGNPTPGAANTGTPTFNIYSKGGYVSVTSAKLAVRANLKGFTNDESQVGANVPSRFGIGTDTPQTRLQVQSARQYDGISLTNGEHETAKIFGGTEANDAGNILLSQKGDPRVALSANYFSYFTNPLGIGTKNPRATLDVNGYARLATQSTAPVACSLVNKGMIALNSRARICSCDGSNWIIADATGAACKW